MEGAWLALEVTESAASRAGLLCSQGIGSLFEEAVQGALGQPSGGSLGDLLQGVEIEVEFGRLAGASSDDFSPSVGEVMQFLELGGCKLA